MPKEIITKRTLTPATIVGELCYHVFEDALGNRIDEEITPEEYHGLGKTHQFPVSTPEKKYKFSFSDFKYSTPSGKMEEGFYAWNGDTQWRAKIDGIDVTTIPKESIVSHSIDQATVDSYVQLATEQNVQWL